MFEIKKKNVFLQWVSLIRPAPAESPRTGRQQGYVVERCDIKLTFFLYLFMLIEPTYSPKQYWTTTLCSGLILSLLSSVLYFIFYWFFYVQQSFIFSIIYLLPLLGSTLTLAFFKHKFVWKEFSYGAAFLMSFATGFISALMFSAILFIAYTFLLESRIDLFENIDNETLQQLMSPLAVSLSMFFINIVLSFIYSLIIAIFAKRKIKE